VSAPGDCAVWWADPTRSVPADAEVLDPVELSRLESLRMPADRARFRCAAALLRRLVAAETGLAPERVRVDRRCPTCDRPHGRPLLPGLGLHASVTHSGDRVGVALTRLGPVGLDVERLGERDVLPLTRLVLGEGEHAADEAQFYRYWTRKESVVKATGAGIVAGLPLVRVSAPDQPPRLLAYPDGPTPAATMHDLSPGDGYAGAVTVLTARPYRVIERWHHPPPGGAGPSA
jgi:4'-phosphopantetheinyl transferase